MGAALSCALSGKKKDPAEAGSLLSGAEERNRTSDLLITNQLLYRLSYFGQGGGY